MMKSKCIINITQHEFKNIGVTALENIISNDIFLKLVTNINTLRENEALFTIIELPYD